MNSKNKKAKKAVRLGVNIDHAATLRQVRGGSTSYPDLLEIVKLIKKAGAHQITIHLREDRRHIQDHDVIRLCRKSPLPINLEMAMSEEMLAVAVKNKPEWVCFVPEKRQELTTEGGLDVEAYSETLKDMTMTLNQKKILVSMFIEPSLVQVEASAAAGAQAVEFHTGAWVLARGPLKNKLWKDLVTASLKAHELGLKVHVGHGLDYDHSKKIGKLPHVREANIGHSMICYSLTEGLFKVTQKMLKALNS